MFLMIAAPRIDNGRSYGYNRSFCILWYGNAGEGSSTCSRLDQTFTHQLPGKGGRSAKEYQGLFFIIVVGIYNLATDRRADLPMDVH